MVIMGYGITLDVEHLKYAVLDRDQTTISRDYTINIAGASRYFIERPPIADYDELDRRMRSGELSMVVEIPPGFGRDVERKLNGALATASSVHSPASAAVLGVIKPVPIGVWIDGAMPQRGETIRGYVQGMHLLWLQEVARHRLGVRQQLGLGQRRLVTPAGIELRYRYNPDVRSLPAMVPAVIPLLLLLIPAMLATLSVVREKDLGSIINFYVTPTTRLEFLLGKQLPYVVLGMLNFLMLTVLAVTLFDVPLKGDFLAAAAGALLYVGCSTGIGLFVSTVTRTQVAALFATAVLTMIPAGNFCGLTDPVSSLEGFGYLVGGDLPHQLLHHDLPRHLQQGARLCRPLRLVHPLADRHPRADRTERGVLEETGELSHAAKQHSAPGRQGVVEPGPRPDDDRADRLRVLRVDLFDRDRVAGHPPQGADRDRRRGPVAVVAADRQRLPAAIVPAAEDGVARADGRPDGRRAGHLRPGHPPEVSGGRAGRALAHDPA